MIGKDKRSKLATIATIVIFVIAMYTSLSNIIRSTIDYIEWSRSLLETIQKVFKKPEIDYGSQTIIPSGRIISNILSGSTIILPPRKSNASFMIVIKGATGQPLEGVRMYIAGEESVYGPFIITREPYTIVGINHQVEVYPGLIIFRNFEEGIYVVSGYYKGYTTEKKIFVKDQHIYELMFPVFVEVFGFPMDLPTFVLFMIGVILLIIVIVVIISEYSFWRRIQLERRLRTYLTQ